MHESERSLELLSIAMSFETDDESSTVSESGRVGCELAAEVELELDEPDERSVSELVEDANDDGVVVDGDEPGGGVVAVVVVVVVEVEAAAAATGGVASRRPS